MIRLWMEVVLLLSAEHTQSQEIVKVLEYKQFSPINMRPVSRIKVFKAARTLVTEEQVPPSQPGNSKSWDHVLTNTPSAD